MFRALRLDMLALDILNLLRFYYDYLIIKVSVPRTPLIAGPAYGLPAAAESCRLTKALSKSIRIK